MTEKTNSKTRKAQSAEQEQKVDEDNLAYPAYISKKISALIFIVIYAVVFTTGWILEGFLSGIKDKILQSLAIDLVMTTVIFVFSLIFQNSSVYDPFWFYGNLVVAWYWFINAGVFNYASIFAITLITLYSMRFTQWFFRQWTGLSYEDFRSKQVKKFLEKFPLNIVYWIIFSLIGYHWIASVIAFNGILPLYYIFYQQSNVRPEIVILGFLVGCFGVGLEYISDEQLNTWRSKKTGKCIDTGLWRYSRHPNYFGECTFWFGLFIIGIGCNRDALWTGVGFLTMIGLFAFITIAWMEHHLKGKEGYTEYKKVVSRFMIWFRSEEKTKKQ